VTAAEASPAPAVDGPRRLARTLEDLGGAVRSLGGARWSRRPDGRNWSPKEIVCHLRDVEELFLTRFMTMLAMDEPKILAFSATPEDLTAWGIGGAIGHPLDPDRWAGERQYLSNDGPKALAAFDRRRRETLALLGGLSAAQWTRAGHHPTRGRSTIAEFAGAAGRARREPSRPAPTRARRTRLIAHDEGRREP
jgi:hypothetical protein